MVPVVSNESSELKEILVALLVFAFGFLPLLGCSTQLGPDRLPVVPVQGQVKLGGKPLAGALVVLHPRPGADSRAIPARGQSDSSGNFQVSTYDANDGAPPGEYSVTVAFHPLVKNGNGFEPGPNVLPRKYAIPVSSDLIVRVSAENRSIPAIELQRR